MLSEQQGLGTWVGLCGRLTKHPGCPRPRKTQVILEMKPIRRHFLVVLVEWYHLDTQGRLKKLSFTLEYCFNRIWL